MLPLRILLAPAALCVLACASALACIHAPLAHKGVVTERLKEAFMFHDGELAHLVIRTSLSAKEGLPASMAWVIPLPSLPKVMEEAGRGIFGELFSLTLPPPPRDLPQVKSEAKKSVAIVSAAPAIKVHAVTVAGDYRLQPIEILSDAAGEELNAWLTQNGFGPVPPENQRFYLRKGAVFLAVRIGALKGTESELKPLHLAYQADRPSLPLKFSSHSGEFDVTLYTLTPDKPAAGALAAFHLEYVHSAEVRGADLDARAPDLKSLIGNRAGWLTRFHGVHYNSPGRMVTQLGADPAFGIATSVTRTAISSEMIEMAQRIGVFALLAMAMVAWTRFRRTRNGKTWRVRSAVYVAVFGTIFFGWFMLVESYADYIKRSKVSMAIDMAGMVKSQIEEKVEKNKTLAGAGAELDSRQGYAVSRDGIISFELDPMELGARLKLVLTPMLKEGRLAWNCQAFPEVAARRFAPAGCRRPD